MVISAARLMLILREITQTIEFTSSLDEQETLFKYLADNMPAVIHNHYLEETFSRGWTLKTLHRKVFGFLCRVWKTENHWLKPSAYDTEVVLVKVTENIHIRNLPTEQRMCQGERWISGFISEVTDFCISEAPCWSGWWKDLDDQGEPVVHQ